MNDFNKGNMRFGLKALLTVVFAIIAIMSFAGVLNAVTAGTLESFIGWAAGVNFIVEGVLIYLFAKNFPNKYEDKKDE